MVVVVQVVVRSLLWWVLLFARVVRQWPLVALPAGPWPPLPWAWVVPVEAWGVGPWWASQVVRGCAGAGWLESALAARDGVG